MNNLGKGEALEEVEQGAQNLERKIKNLSLHPQDQFAIAETCYLFRVWNKKLVAILKEQKVSTARCEQLSGIPSVSKVPSMREEDKSASFMINSLGENDLVGETYGVGARLKPEVGRRFISNLEKELGIRLDKMESALDKQRKSGRPYCVEKNGKGYLHFSGGEEVEIGSLKSDHYRLLRSLTEPHIDVAKNIEVVFEAMREGKAKKGVYNKNSIDRKAKIKSIKNAIKELQRGNKLKHKLEFVFDDSEVPTKIWLEYTG